MIKSREKRLIIYGITDRGQDSLWDKINDFLIDNSKVSQKEKMFFFNSLSLMLGSGVSLTRTIKILAEKSKNIRLKRILNTVHYDMTYNGQTFSAALEKYPTVFSRNETKVLYSGELTGNLEQTLSSVSLQVQKNIQITTKIKQALTYPTTVLITLILASLTALTFIIPKFQNLFESLGTELPLLTTILIKTSFVIKNDWWLLLGLLGIIVFIFSSWKNSPSGRLKFDKFILKNILFGEIYMNFQTHQIASNLSTFLDTGISLNKSLKILSDIVQNKVCKNDLLQIEQSIKKGGSLSESFATSNFDPILSEVMSIGEASGKIAEILKKTAIQYSFELDSQLKRLNELIEPIVLLLTSGAVILLALAILLPVFKLQEAFI